MNRTFSSYWKTNIWETTSGNFGTELLDFHTRILGPERILYSVGYPFVMMQQGAEWVDSLEWGREEKLGFVRGNAIDLLRLDDCAEKARTMRETPWLKQNFLSLE
jgi:2,3-dihydroxybenzoate decarboxylase